MYPINKSLKISKTFICETCDYICSKQSEYNKHLSTNKHKILQNPTNELRVNVFTCKCGKKYKHSSTLYAHKNKCKYIDNVKKDVTPVTNENVNTNIGIDSHAVIMLLKQNDEFKSLMLEQYTQLQETSKQNIELQRQLVDAVKNNTNPITNVTHNNNHNTTNNNQKFNLNFFLNDTCKDAMNITDFLRNFDIQVDELEYIGNHGYVNGMTKMIMDRLKGMDITKRPIHCTDIKRETMYIKDKDEWSKDTDELSKLRKILGRITMNNYKAVPEWKTAHPECEEMDSRDYNFCYKMMRVILGDVEDEQIKLDNKIIKTMAKDLFVNKSNTK